MQDENQRIIDGVTYKRSPITNAYWWNNGAWVASSKTNDYIFSLKKPTVAMHKSRCAPLGMSDAMTYCEAREMYQRISDGETTAGKEGRANHMDIKTVKRAMEIYEDRGALGFARFDHDIGAITL